MLTFMYDINICIQECARPQFESKIKKMYEKQGTTRLEGPEGPTGKILT